MFLLFFSLIELFLPFKKVSFTTFVKLCWISIHASVDVRMTTTVLEKNNPYFIRTRCRQSREKMNLKSSENHKNQLGKLNECLLGHNLKTRSSWTNQRSSRNWCYWISIDPTTRDGWVNTVDNVPTCLRKGEKDDNVRVYHYASWLRIYQTSIIIDIMCNRWASKMMCLIKKSTLRFKKWRYRWIRLCHAVLTIDFWHVPESSNFLFHNYSNKKLYCWFLLRYWMES